MEQPEQGYTIKQYSKIIGKHPNTVRLMVKDGRLPVKTQRGRTGYEYRIFPNGLPENDSEAQCLPNSKVNNEALALPGDMSVKDVMHLMECKGKLEVLERENQFLKDQLSTRAYLDPWRALIEKTGKLMLFLLSPFNPEKS